MKRYLVAALLLAGCTGTTAPGRPTVTSAPPEQAAAVFFSPRAEFPVWEIELAGRPWAVAVADTPERRQAGLMGVEDLGDLDGMLFVFPESQSGSFWMKDTLMPLDIAFFEEGGDLVAVLEMEPCRADPCPSYGPGAPYRWALEAPAGELANLPPDAHLRPPEG
ncbi:MAG: DUF192 domain-containing protein [Acidimicrobiia bacterium]